MELISSLKKLQQKSLNLRFNEWQNTTIFTKSYDTIEINKLISIFVDEGLIPFINKNKYNLYVNKEIIKEFLSSILFYNDNNIKYNLLYNNYYEEAFEDFEYYLDWNKFWIFWNYKMDNFFYYYNIIIQQLIWQFIDLNKSEAYLDNLEESDSDDDKVKKFKNIDPYILDQMNKIYHRKAED